MAITRRDFLNGTALTIAAGLTPQAQVAADPDRYPPALTGMRGQHDGSFGVAHAIARNSGVYRFEGLAPEESYDLVVVGGGISGLAAAWFYRRARPDARVLVLDCLDDFGGHAKRNEFAIDGRRLIGYGGSESIQSPGSLWSTTAKELLRELGVEPARFESAFDRGFYGSLGLSRGLFFSREAFGRDALVVGDAAFAGDAGTRDLKSIALLLEAYPISAASRAQLLAVYGDAADPLRGKSVREKLAILRHTSYRDYLMKICGCSEEVANCFSGQAARLLRPWHRCRCRRRPARIRLSGVRPARLAGGSASRVGRALHLSFS